MKSNDYKMYGFKMNNVRISEYLNNIKLFVSCNNLKPILIGILKQLIDCYMQFLRNMPPETI